MKKPELRVFFVCMLLAALVPALFAESAASAPSLATLLNHHAARPAEFAAGAILKVELDLIISAGLRSSSDNNRQPWRFTVVQNPSILSKIVPTMPDGNIIIIVSAQGAQGNSAVLMDCALAAQSMYLAAQAQGLSSRMYTSTLTNINNNLRAELGISADYSAVAMVRIGRMSAGVDAVSAPSSRKPAESIVTYRYSY
jgi:nitroreductase